MLLLVVPCRVEDWGGVRFCSVLLAFSSICGRYNDVDRKFLCEAVSAILVGLKTYVQRLTLREFKSSQVPCWCLVTASCGFVLGKGRSHSCG
jgi:hypothetical protein